MERSGSVPVVRASTAISDVQVVRFVEPERSGSADELSA
jgi:hypothetical protein